jgi:uncharacterized zinc-type alcohol dehydrogenase-like protein
MAKIRGWMARAPSQPLALQEYDAGPLGAEEVEVEVTHCGLCHSDLSVINSEWGPSPYPFVPGHEVVGRVSALGEHAKALGVGDVVGIGWTASSCMQCRWCLSGDPQLCARAVPTIVGHQGGFAERLRAHWAWAVPLPRGLDATSAAPLLCGGITVFSPLLLHGVRPTQRVGVVGIGGLGHLAVKFAAAWGCEVTAFTSHESKFDEARGFGASRVLSSTDGVAIRKLRGTIDLLLVTANAALDWAGLMATLAPKGRMHLVGAVPEPIPVAAFDLIGGQRAVSGSPTGSPVEIAAMLAFAARHGVAPEVEHFPMSRVNEALDHLASGKARYRVVLDANFR